MILAMRRSFTRSDHCLPLLPVKRKRTSLPSTATWRLEGSQAVAVVLLGVLIVPDPDQRGFKKMHHCREDLFTRQPAECHVLFHCVADHGKRVGEGHHVPVFGALAHFAEKRMVTGTAFGPRRSVWKLPGHGRF